MHPVPEFDISEARDPGHTAATIKLLPDHSTFCPSLIDSLFESGFGQAIAGVSWGIVDSSLQLG